MIAVDTNVLVRILVTDPGEPDQVERARNAARNADQLFVPQIVQVETVWVLERAYQIKKLEMLRVLQHLIENQAFVLQRAEHFEDALELFSQGKADFSDYLILAEAKSENLELLTFDKALSQSTGVRFV